jgi:hypothetical protein
MRTKHFAWNQGVDGRTYVTFVVGKEAFMRLGGFGGHVVDGRHELYADDPETITEFSVSLYERRRPGSVVTLVTSDGSPVCKYELSYDRSVAEEALVLAVPEARPVRIHEPGDPGAYRRIPNVGREVMVDADGTVLVRGPGHDFTADHGLSDAACARLREHTLCGIRGEVDSHLFA